MNLNVIRKCDNGQTEAHHAKRIQASKKGNTVSNKRRVVVPLLVCLSFELLYLLGLLQWSVLHSV